MRDREEKGPHTRLGQNLWVQQSRCNHKGASSNGAAVSAEVAQGCHILHLTHWSTSRRGVTYFIPAEHVSAATCLR